MARRHNTRKHATLFLVGLVLSVGAAPSGEAPPSPPSTKPVAEPPAPAAREVMPDFAAPRGDNPASEPPPPADVPEPPALPAPGEVVAPVPGPVAPASDPDVEKVQAAGTPPASGPRPTPPQPVATPVTVDPSGLPGAVANPANPAPAAATASSTSTPGESPAFVLPADRIPLGRQAVALTVDVVAPQVLNLNQTANFKVVVRNNGSADALGVVVRDELPPGLEFVSSQPEAQRIDTLLSWNIGTLNAGAERVITLGVKPTRTGSFDHAATVSLMAGGKSRTMVREPKLKVEQTVVSSKVLRGQPVHFKIAVSNPGDGPARNVVVQAKLSPGLRHESGEPNDQNLFEQSIDLLNPGERRVLDTLVADATQGGEQNCLIVASSSDVVPGAEEAKSLQVVTVVEPKLKLALTGPDKRYTDTLATYELTLENPGTAPARNVRVQATLPVSGRLFAIPNGAQFDRQTRRLVWTRPQLEAGEKATMSFQVRMGGIGLYQIPVESRADGALLAKEIVATDVSGLADVDFNVSEKRRVVDVNDETTFVIRVVNSGTKEANRLLISGVLSENVEPVQTSGTEEPAKFNPAEHKLVFPPIERLGPGKSIDLGIQVRATKPGIATCRVYLLHDDLPEKLDDVAAFKVTPTRR